MKNSTKKSKKPSVKYIWSTFVSPYIRKRDLDFSGYGTCISCGAKITYETCDAGHFVPKRKGEWFRWLEDNIHAQCVTCNRFGSHDTGADYSDRLCAKIGKKRVDFIKSQRGKSPKETRTLEEIKNYYKDKLESL